MLVYSVVKASEILDSTGYKQAVCSTLCWALPYKPKSSTNPGSEAEALVPLWSSMLEEAAWSLLQLELQSLPQLPWQNLPEIEKQEGGNMLYCFYVVWFFCLFLWNKTAQIFSATRSQRDIFIIINNNQKDSDVTGTRKIHPKLYHISPRRLISEPRCIWVPVSVFDPCLGPVYMCGHGGTAVSSNW